MTVRSSRPQSGLSGPAQVAHDVARRHGVTGIPSRATWRGATSDVFAGEHAGVKVARPRPDAVAALPTDVEVAHVMAAHGVSIPAVLASREREPVAWAGARAGAGAGPHLRSRVRPW
jgi:hypothetical protein